MKRNINVIAKNYITKINDFDPVSIENIGSIVDCSIDNIVLGCLELIDKKLGKNIFEILCQKLRPQGTLIVKFNDLKDLCQKYINNSISNIDLLQVAKNLENPLSLDEIITYIDINKFKIVNITKDANYITLHIMRISL